MVIHIQNSNGRWILLVNKDVTTIVSLQGEKLHISLNQQEIENMISALQIAELACSP